MELGGKYLSYEHNKVTLKSLFVTTLLKVSAEASSDVVPIFGFDGPKLVKRVPKRKVFTG